MLATWQVIVGPESVAGTRGAPFYYINVVFAEWWASTRASAACDVAELSPCGDVS